METSHTVSTMAKMAKICPFKLGSDLEKAANTRFAPFSTSSTPIRTKMEFRLVITTNNPAQKSAAAK